MKMLMGHFYEDHDAALVWMQHLYDDHDDDDEIVKLIVKISIDDDYPPCWDMNWLTYHNESNATKTELTDVK